MTNLQIIRKLQQNLKKKPGSIQDASDLFEMLRIIEKDDFDKAHTLNKELRKLTAKQAKNKDNGLELRTKFYELHKKTLLFDAPHDFDAYLQYVEFDRDPKFKFYLPRRHYLLPIVQAYQEVLDGKLKLLTVSMPKRAGKSQLGINFVCMISGKFPDRSTLMEGTGDDLVKSFYQGCLEYLQTPSEYLFYDIFPNSRLVQTNADTKIINLAQRSRFPTIMCRSIDSRQVGLSEATNVLYLDDCVEGREEAMNRDRLDMKWTILSGDVIGRAIEGTPIIATGTRYSIYDPIGRLQEEAEKQGWTWKSIEIPALDPVTDESNYEYYNPKLERKVFTTEYFRQQRELLSPEQFESEFQQQPFEAKGLMFPEDKLNRYINLPEGKDPDAILAVCDTAERGEDSVAMPVAYIYGDDVYIEDCVFDNSPPEITKPQCAKKLVAHKVPIAVFESNNAGEYYARDVEKLVRDMGGRVSIRLKRSITNKHTRIEMASDGILKHFWFKDKSQYKPADQYGRMMKELTTYTRTGKVKHDDAPDAMSLLENTIRSLVGTKVEVIKRPF